MVHLFFNECVVDKYNAKVTVAQVVQVEREDRLGSWSDWRGIKSD